MSKAAQEPQCMSLTGTSGAGKSTLVRDYANAFPRKLTKNRTVVPVLYVETPSPVTVKGMCSTMLDALGDPVAFKGTLASMNHRLIGFIHDCDVELIIRDEFHHLIDSETNRILEKVSEWLKSLIKKTGKPFLVVGIEGKVENILRTNQQLSRLFPIREKIDPLVFETTKENEFVQFVVHVEKAMGMQLTTTIQRAELLRRMHYSTDGIIGHIMNLMRYATWIAQNEGHQVIEEIDLCRAFNRRISNVLWKKVNPFEESVGKVFSPPKHHASEGPSGDQYQRHARKERKPPVSELLTAR
jgi:energy-coupling factor transporter ATP-binding protein EcfA2